MFKSINQSWLYCIPQTLLIKNKYLQKLGLIPHIPNKLSTRVFTINKKHILNFISFNKLSNTFNRRNSFIYNNSSKILSLTHKTFCSNEATEDVLLTQSEALLMNEHDRICILFSSNAISKENLLNFINELLDICMKLSKFARYMQGWDILSKFLVQNINNMNTRDFLRFVEGFGAVLYPDNGLWNKIFENMLNRDLKSEEFLKVLYIVSRYKQDEQSIEKLCEHIKILFSNNFFSDKPNKQSFNKTQKSQEATNNDAADKSLTFLNNSNSLVLFNVILPNILDHFQKNPNSKIASFFNEIIVKKFLDFLATENLTSILSKKDIIIALRICGHLFNNNINNDNSNINNNSLIREQNSTELVEKFIQQIVLLINKIKFEDKSINFIVSLFLMLKSIDFIYEKNSKLFENLIIIIADNYPQANDLVKFSFYFELLHLCSSKPHLYKVLIEKSQKNESSDLFTIKNLTLPNEEAIRAFHHLTEVLKSESSPLDFPKYKYDFFKKYNKEIGVSLDKIDEFTRNNYSLINNLSNIFN